jgi:hypothetical protein
MGTFERPKRPDPTPARSSQPTKRSSATEPKQREPQYVSHRLLLDQPWLRLPITEIGKVASASVVVTNPDETARTLDPATPLAADPFGEVAIVQSTSDTLAAHQSVALDVEFRPSRAVGVEHAFQISTDRGLGPTAELRVSGEGFDLLPTQERDAAQDRERVDIEARHVRDPLRANRVHAETAVRDWAGKAITLDANYAEWIHNNWLHFLGKTGGDVRFSPPSLSHVIATKALAKATSKLAAPELAGSPAASKILEKSIERLAEYVWDELTGTPAPASPEQAGVDADTHISHQAIAKGTELARYRERADLVIRDAESTALLVIAQSPSTAELDAWQAWSRAQIAQLPAKRRMDDFSLSDELLAAWVLQRAASPTEAGSTTNETAWQAARAELAATRRLPTLERTDLFVHQCRHEWAELAIHPAEIDIAISRLDVQRERIEEEARNAGASPEMIANRIAQLLGPQALAAWFHRSTDWARTGSLLAKQAYWLDPTVDGRTYLDRYFDLTCTLKLNTSGAGVIVQSFEYDLSPPGEKRAGEAHVERKP